ncbi:hypothetical protein KVV02_006261 [Mortierella alpina]|uniref:Uncharacterized protein n=1 Tax=Mortierella alpina TaxID=64518 RepID=A0A9P8A6U7_MORAP|nr:hypothetical protein KVV02_006261 [Mortierella alpina]
MSSSTTTLAQRDSSAPGPSPTRPAPVTTSVTTTTAAPPPITHTPPPVPTPTSAAPPVVTVPSSAPPVVTTTSTVPSAAPTSTLNTPCMSSSQCGENQLCAYQSQGAITGYCQAMVDSLCRSNPVIPCQSSAQCNSPAYSYCVAPDAKDPLNKICTGLGMPGTDTQCGAPGTSGGSSGGSGNNSSLTNTLKYAGIAVGSVALLGIIFAVVRWQRNKRRSTIPDFAEIDYGMSNRHRSSAGAAAVVSGSGGAEQSYPFSNRPNAATTGAAAGGAGATNDQDGFYDDQYYDDQYAQNMHPMAGMAAGGLHKQQASQDQYYDQYAQNNHYDPQQQAYDEQYYKEAAAYGGYDQHGNYVGDGTYYDNNAAYGDYGTQQQQQQQQYGASQVVPSTGAEYAVTSPTSPLDAHLRANGGAVNQYGVEPSELDFGGTTQAPGAHGGGYGQRY